MSASVLASDQEPDKERDDDRDETTYDYTSSSFTGGGEAATVLTVLIMEVGAFERPSANGEDDVGGRPGWRGTQGGYRGIQAQSVDPELTLRIRSEAVEARHYTLTLVIVGYQLGTCSC